MKLMPAAAALCLLAATSVAHAADPNLGRNLAATCANCHGTNGHAVKGGGLDSLAGMERPRPCKNWPISRAATSPPRSCTRSPRAIPTSSST